MILNRLSILSKTSTFAHKGNVNARRTIRTWLVDAFTETPFRGNPAEIVYLPSALKSRFHQLDVEQWMQEIAAENHIPVSTFLVHLQNNEYAIRWFTPTKELELCGHGTITASHVLYNELAEVLPSQEIRFHTKHSGILSASSANPSFLANSSAAPSASFIRLTFPNTRLQPHSLSQNDKESLVKAFSLPNIAFLDQHILHQGKTMYDIVLHVSLSLFHSLPYENNDGHPTIDFSSLRDVQTNRGIILTTNDMKSDPGSFDFMHRMFLPRFGINEDHVSGSGFCAIAEYWQQTLQLPVGSVIIGLQNSKRSGVIHIQINPENPDKIHLFGTCVTTKIGTLLVKTPVDNSTEP
jgi:predicted PhzF superfamily epimerase YddE/YHI9